MRADLFARRTEEAAELARGKGTRLLSAISQTRVLQFLLLTVTAAAAALAARAVSPLQETMRTALSLSDNQMALLQGPALAFPVVLSAIPLGFVIDRYTRVRLLSGFAVLALAGSLLTALATGFATLFLARCAVGLGTTAIIITGFSLLADLYPIAQRGRAKAVLVLGQYGGNSLAFGLGGVLLAALGSPQEWRWAMVWLTGPALALSLLATMMLSEPPRTGVGVAKPSSRQTIAELWRYRRMVVPLVLGVVFAEIPLFAVATWGAPTLSRGFGLTPDRVGTIMATTMMVSGVLGPIIGGSLADLCQRAGGPRRTVTVLAGLALVCAPAGLFGIMPNVAATSALLVTCITLVAGSVAMGVTLFTIVVPNELRGLCLAIMAAAVSLFGAALAPVLVSVLSGVIGGPATIGRALAVVCVAGSILCATTFAVARRSVPGRALM